MSDPVVVFALGVQALVVVFTAGALALTLARRWRARKPR